MINAGTFMQLLATKQLTFSKSGLSLFNMPIVFCPAPFLSEFQQYLEKKYGYEKARDLLIEGFKGGGASFTKNYAKSNKFKHKRDIIQWSLDLMSNAGWGEFKILELDEEQRLAKFSIANSPFTKLIKSNKPVDHIIVGLIKGVAENLIFEQPMEVIETKCQAKGDALCEIIVRPTTNHKKKSRNK